MKKSCPENRKTIASDTDKALIQANKELAILNRLAKTLTSVLSIKEACSAAIRELSKALKPDAAFIFLQEDNKLRLCAMGPDLTYLKAEDMPVHILGECLCGLAAKNGKKVFSANINKDKRCTWPECKKAGFRSFAAIPLVFGTEHLGVMGLASASGKNFKKDSRFLKTAADQLAVSIYNAKQFEKTLNYAAQLENHIKERERAEKEQRLNESRLSALLELSRMTSQPDQTLTDFALEKAITLTGSDIGYLAFMNEDETVLTMYSWSRKAMKECLIKTKPLVYPVKDTGLWGEAVRQRKPVITNDYAAPNSLKKGYPEGHVHVSRHMNIPLFDGEKIVLVAGVGNKDEPYGEPDIRQFTLLMDGMWKIIKQNRSEEARKKAEQDKEKLQAQLLQAQKMEAIGTLAGGVAHDFNNLLMGILGYTSLMLMKTDISHPFYEKLKTIERQVESGADLTRQLLGFARGGKYEVKPVDVNDLIIKTSEIFGRTKKEITVHRKLQEDLNTTEADRGQLEQVLFNLYVNAWQAMPSGGRLYIETQNINLDENESHVYNIASGPYLKISVTDTGVGMDETTRQRIFEPFFTTKGIGKGTGLGLASAYGIIKNHNGAISVYSEKGHGTTFSIYLPASEKKTVAKKPEEGIPLRGNETILVVDDEPINTNAVKDILEEFGYKVLTAGSGREAIEKYMKHREEIQLVILDMIMPEMNGKETLIKLRETDKDVRVLLSSGYSINGEAKNILSLGFIGFIQKPFRVDELSHKIRQALDHKA